MNISIAKRIARDAGLAVWLDRGDKIWMIAVHPGAQPIRRFSSGEMGALTVEDFQRVCKAPAAH